MTAIGVPAGYALGWKLFENILPLFIARVIALALSAVANCFRIYRHAQRDEIEYDNCYFQVNCCQDLTPTNLRRN